MQQRFLMAAVVVMIGFPWLAVTLAGDAGMAVCFILFFAVNPLFAAVIGFFAGRQVKRFWWMPIATPGLFLAGVWCFFELGEPAFLLYSGCYLVFGVTAMLLSVFLDSRKTE